MDKEFKGVYPALITPMNSDGKLNESALRKVIEFNINAGIHGFWVAGRTGESVLLDDEENRRIAQIVSEESKGRIKNIMHVGTPTTARSAKLAEHAAKSGVEAICCVPPFFYPQSDDAIVEHYRVVASAADLPFFVYNLPQSTQVEITPDLMQKIKRGETFSLEKSDARIHSLSATDFVVEQAAQSQNNLTPSNQAIHFQRKNCCPMGGGVPKSI